MKQVLQHLGTGETELVDVPAPRAAAGALLIATTRTLVSAGTERMLVEFGKANWIDKARQQPDKVRMVLDKARTDGVAATWEAVQSKLDQPLALGYCNVGRVIEAGAGVAGFSAGDRVVSNGKHAEVVSVPLNLCARIPEGVSDEHAAFTVLGAIGLQGIRLAGPTLGECVAVTGLGLIGLMTVQMLRAQGCRVLGIDPDAARRELARGFGAEVVDPVGGDVLAAADAFSRGRGMDAVLITASTQSNAPVEQAARMSRKRGRIVLVGVTGLALSRADFYEKELSFQVSCSYGPGRYDPAYEEGGQDYPVGLVRWTEQRNFEAVLDLMASGALQLDVLVSHRFALAQACDAYALLSSGAPSLGIVLDYGSRDTGDPALVARRVALSAATPPPRAEPGGAPGPRVPRVGFLGAGNYAGRVLIPAFRAAGAVLDTVVSTGGVSAVHHGRKHGFAHAGTDPGPVFEDPTVDTVVVATRHDSHAALVLAALRHGKHVFCEKPLCLAIAELEEIAAEARSRPAQRLMVGFNRRFAPHVQRMQALLAGLDAPRHLAMTVNAGAIPANHWTQSRAIGGGRIVGEGCHFVDLLRFLAAAPIVDADATALGGRGSAGPRDSAVLRLRFTNGSIGTIHYLANGHKAVPKERLEVTCAGRVLQLDNFRRLAGFGWPGFSSTRAWRQDKGQSACVAAFVGALSGDAPSPIPLDQLLEVSRASIHLQEQLDA